MDVDKDSERLLTPREREFLARNPSAELVSPETDSAKTSDIKGVEGWLGFLAISLAFLGPLITIVMTVMSIKGVVAASPELMKSRDWSHDIAILWGITSAYCAVSIFAGYLLFKRHVPQTVPIVIACLWLSGPVLGIFSLFAFELSPSDGASIGRSIITTVIWTTYLLRSKRVCNTYGRTA